MVGKKGEEEGSPIATKMYHGNSHIHTSKRVSRILNVGQYEQFLSFVSCFQLCGWGSVLGMG